MANEYRYFLKDWTVADAMANLRSARNGARGPLLDACRAIGKKPERAKLNDLVGVVSDKLLMSIYYDYAEV
jgi:hypothetical protein